MSKTQLPKCSCGGSARWVPGGGFIDQLECNKCEYKTHAYWDGAEYALAEWKKKHKK